MFTQRYCDHNLALCCLMALPKEIAVSQLKKLIQMAGHHYRQVMVSLNVHYGCYGYVAEYSHASSPCLLTTICVHSSQSPLPHALEYDVTCQASFMNLHELLMNQALFCLNNFQNQSVFNRCQIWHSCLLFTKWTATSWVHSMSMSLTCQTPINVNVPIFIGMRFFSGLLNSYHFLSCGLVVFHHFLEQSV